MDLTALVAALLAFFVTAGLFAIAGFGMIRSAFSR